jgi:hypothetical protein
MKIIIVHGEWKGTQVSFIIRIQLKLLLKMQLIDRFEILSNRLTSYQLYRYSNTQKGRLMKKGGNSVSVRIEGEEDEKGITHFNVRCREGINLLHNSKISPISAKLHNDKTAVVFKGTCHAHAVEGIDKTFFIRFQTEREATEFIEMYGRFGKDANVTGEVAEEETGNDDAGTADPPTDGPPLAATRGDGGGFTTVDRDVAEEETKTCNDDAVAGGPPVATTRDGDGGGGDITTVDEGVAEENRNYDPGNDDDPPTDGPPVAATRGDGGFTTVDKDVTEDVTETCNDDASAGDSATAPVAPTRAVAKGQYADTSRNIWSVPKTRKVGHKY